MSGSISVVIGVVVALVGSGGVVFGALRYNRQEAAGMVGIMREVSDELRLELERTQIERDELREAVGNLRTEVTKLRKVLEEHGWTYTP